MFGKYFFITLAILISFLYYQLIIVDPQVSWKLKLVHYFVILRSFYTGVAFGHFNRNMTHGPATCYEENGISSSYIHVPHHLEKDYKVLTKYFINKNETSTTLLLYMHGGGFVYEEYAIHDDYLREITKKGINVLSIQYRVAPEHKFPTPVHDSYSVLAWLKTEIKKENSVLGKIEKIVLGGDSAGGNLVGVVTLMNKQMNLNLEISKQILVYPTFFSDIDHPHIEQDHYILTSRMVKFFIKAYLGDNPKEHANSTLLNPLVYKESFSFLPKTVVITATFDPLKPEGELYHKRILKDGVDSKIYNFDSIHGFAAFKFDDSYQSALDLVINEVRN